MKMLKKSFAVVLAVVLVLSAIPLQSGASWFYYSMLYEVGPYRIYTDNDMTVTDGYVGLLRDYDIRYDDGVLKINTGKNFCLTSKDNGKTAVTAPILVQRSASFEIDTDIVTKGSTIRVDTSGTVSILIIENNTITSTEGEAIHFYGDGTLNLNGSGTYQGAKGAIGGHKGTVNLNGTFTFQAAEDGYAGIDCKALNIQDGCHVTIGATANAPGIGSTNGNLNPSVTMTNATVTVNGGTNAPAIGGGAHGSQVTNVSIFRSLVTLNEGENAPSILPPPDMLCNSVRIDRLSSVKGDVGSNVVNFSGEPVTLHNVHNDGRYVSFGSEVHPLRYHAPDDRSLYLYLSQSDAEEMGETEVGRFGDLEIEGVSAGFPFEKLTLDGNKLTVQTDKPFYVRNIDSNTPSSTYLDLPADQEAHIILDGVNITAPDGCGAIHMPHEHDKPVTVTIKEGTFNVLRGGSNSGAIKREVGNGSLTIDGTGELMLYGGANADAIGSLAHIMVCNVTLKSGVINLIAGSDFNVRALYIDSGVHYKHTFLISAMACVSHEVNGAINNFEGLVYASLRNEDVEGVFCLTIPNPEHKEVWVNGKKMCGTTQIGMDVLFVYLKGQSHAVKVGDTTTFYRFDSKKNTFVEYSPSLENYDTGRFVVTGGVPIRDYFYDGGEKKLTIRSTDVQNPLTISQKNNSASWDGHITFEKNHDAHIILDGINLNGGWPVSIPDNSTGNVTITLADGSVNRITVPVGVSYACIQKNTNTDEGSLHLNGTGTLIAHSSSGPAIGANTLESTSNIYIEDGTYELTSTVAAAIGSSHLGSVNNIYISGGTIKAKSNDVAIGACQRGNCGNIYISGGKITAEGAVGIGAYGDLSGHSKTRGVYITGGVISATGTTGVGIGSATNGYGTSSLDKLVIDPTASVKGVISSIQPQNSRGEDVFLQKLHNPDGKTIYVDGRPLSITDHLGEKTLYLYLSNRSHNAYLDDELHEFTNENEVWHFHNFDGDVVDNGDGTHNKKCTICDVYGGNFAHVGGTGVYKDNGDDTHSEKCEACGAFGEKENHRVGAGIFRNMNDGTHLEKCPDCGAFSNASAHTFENGTCTACGSVYHADINQDNLCDDCGKEVYVARYWDAENKQVVESWNVLPDTPKTVTDTLNAGEVYVVEGAVTVRDRIQVLGTAENPTSIVLKDNAVLNASSGIHVTEGHRLIIYTQVLNNGKLTAQNDGYSAGIGGGHGGKNSGDVIVHGGQISAVGSQECAGIGGYQFEGKGGVFTMFSGEVIAQGGEFDRIGGAGIGGGSYGNAGKVTLYGGTLMATGGGYAAGIGGGSYGEGGDFAMYGGSVVATSGHNLGDGIGSGRMDNRGTITLGLNNPHIMAASEVNYTQYGIHSVTLEEYLRLNNSTKTTRDAYVAIHEGDFTDTYKNTGNGTHLQLCTVCNMYGNEAPHVMENDGCIYCDYATLERMKADAVAELNARKRSFVADIVEAAIENIEKAIYTYEVTSIKNAALVELSKDYSKLSLSVNGVIDVNIKLDLLAYGTADKASARFTYNDSKNYTFTETEVTKSAKELTKENGLYVYTVSQVPAQVAEDITVEILVDGEVVATKTVSAKKYCDLQIENSEDENLVNFCKSLMLYAQECQTYFGYESNIEGYKVITEDKYGTIGDVEITDAGFTANAPEGVKLTGVTFMALSNSAVRFYYSGTVGEVTSDKFNVRKGVNGTNTYIEVYGIEAANLDEVFTISIDGAEAITGSALSYAKTAMSSGNVGLVKVAKAIAYYNAMADAYYGA